VDTYHRDSVRGKVASLARLEDLPAGIVLPGHGEPFVGTPAEAARLARAAGVRR
jgi:glyoxylase-like metal-dependent hydrolase (beta-lactamase superfamily II)